MDAKICGVKNINTLNYLLKHKYPPKYIGFICNYPKEKKKLIKNRKKKIKFVSVLVKPNNSTLKKIEKLKFDYLQLYNVSPKRTLKIKKNLNIKIISAITVKNLKDIMLYEKYSNISDIILFDGKGYEKSIGFNHNLLKKINNDKIIKMLAGNIKFNDKLNKFKNIADIVDLSGSLETNGEKDILKIDVFLKKINNINK